MKLKQCPFCGSKADFLEIIQDEPTEDYAEGAEPFMSRVLCVNCTTEGPAAFTRAEAFEKWNLRDKRCADLKIPLDPKPKIG